MMMNNHVLRVEIPFFTSREMRRIFLFRLSTLVSMPILHLLSVILFPLKPIFAFLLIILPLFMYAYFVQGEMYDYMEHLDLNFRGILPLHFIQEEMDTYIEYLDLNFLGILALHRMQTMQLLKRCTLMAMVFMLWLSPKMGLFDLPLICKHAEMSSLWVIKNNLFSFKPCCYISSPPPFVATDHNRGFCSKEEPALCPIKNISEVIFGQIMDEEGGGGGENNASADPKFGVFCKMYLIRLLAMLIVCVFEDLWIKKVKRVIADIYARAPFVRHSFMVE